MVDGTVLTEGQAASCAASRRLRIAHVVATFPPYFAGTGTVCYYSALALAHRGHRVTVFTAAHPARAYPYPDQFAVKRLPVLFRLGNAPVLPQLLGLSKFDIIHLHYPFIFGAEMVWAVSKARGIPYVITHHNDLMGDGARRYLFNLYSAVSTRVVLGRASRLVVVSRDHAAHCRLGRLFGRRWADVVEVPNGVDASLFRPGLDGNMVRERHDIPLHAGVMLFVGALDRAHHFKGVPHLIKAFARIRDRHTALLIVGDGDQRGRFLALAAERGLTERVRFAGAVDHEKLPAYLAAADALVLPSMPPESFGIVLVEAMACGKPVLAHDIPGVRVVVDDGVNGLLVQPGDEGGLTAKMELLLAAPGLRARMGAAGRRKVEERYDWRHIGARLEQVYTTVLNHYPLTRVGGMPEAGRNDGNGS